MATSFRIDNVKNNGNLTLMLKGDFDGSSAFELIHTLQANRGRVKEVVVNTDGLCSIHPWGLGMFQKKFSVKKMNYTVKITGKHADVFVPQNTYSLG